MNKPELFKVQVSEKLTPTFERLLMMLHANQSLAVTWKVPSGTSGAHNACFPQQLALPYFDQAIADYEAVTQKNRLLQAQNELAEQDRADDLLELYVAIDRERYLLNMTYTFKDKDTAMLFKLSL